MVRFTNVPNAGETLWLPVMVCTSCGRESFDASSCPSCGNAVKYSGKVKDIENGRTRELEPQNEDEANKLSIGYGVVFQ